MVRYRVTVSENDVIVLAMEAEVKIDVSRGLQLAKNQVFYDNSMEEVFCR